MGPRCSVAFSFAEPTKIPFARISGGGRDLLLNRLLSGFLRANPDGVLDGTDEDLAVADFAGFGGFDDGFYGGCNLAVGQNDFDFYFGKKINRVLAAAIDFSVPFLATKTFDFTDCHSFH